MARISIEAVGLLSAMLTGWFAPAAVAQSFDKATPSERLTIVVGYPPGAAYDVYARALSRHMGKHLAGSPTISVQNMPGAGSLAAANFLYNTAPKDGSVIGMFSRGVAVQPLFDPDGIRFDPLKFNWLGSPSTDVSFALAWHLSPIKTFQDMISRGMTMAASGPGADATVFPNVLNALLGTNIKIVTGYQGAADSLLAIERGEVDGTAGISWSTLASSRPEWLHSGKVSFLIQLATRGRDDLKDVPLVTSLAKTEVDRRVLELIFSRQTMAYPFAAPPGVPSARVAALRRAFNQTIADPAYIDEAKRLGMSVNLVTGQEIQEIIMQAFSAPPQIIQRARAAIATPR
ncbi:MAG: tripartite tricarboxylate transporter family receptor [Hyphomicrobiales bacterium]|nr:tripartite tricarboxylate transporter family receptor [Hyphomicrobiales bacterium]